MSKGAFQVPLNEKETIPDLWMVKAPGAPRQEAKGRRCKCGAILSIYNHRKTCNSCWKKRKKSQWK